MDDSRTGMSARNLALAAVVGNLVVCALIAMPILAIKASGHEAVKTPPAPMPIPTSTVGQTTAPSASTSTASPTSESSESAIPTGFESVTGPAGIATTIPTGWQVGAATGAGSVQATDPAETTRFLRYGGSASSSKSVLETQKDYERTFAKARPGYSLVDLSAGSLRDHEATTWEFEFNSDGGRKHVKSIYWRAGGTDYFVYASSMVPKWSEMQTIFDTVVANAQP